MHLTPVTCSSDSYLVCFYVDGLGVRYLTAISQAKVREVFSMAEAAAPAIVFIDEIDSIGAKRSDVGAETERRVVSTLLPTPHLTLAF